MVRKKSWCSGKACLVTCLVPSLEFHSEREYLTLCRLTALCSTSPNKLRKHVPWSFFVRKLHYIIQQVEHFVAVRRVCFSWRGPKGTRSLVPRQVWWGCCFCNSCRYITFVSRKILKNVLRWMDKSWGEMWIYERKHCGYSYLGGQRKQKKWRYKHSVTR